MTQSQAISRALKVVTVTLNPALDLTGSLDALSPGSVNLVNAGSLHPAGKGVNVAKVLAELGADVTVTGLLGADNQEPFCQLFDELGAKDAFVRVKGASRINVKLVEQNGRVSDFNFPGVEVGEEDLKAFDTTLKNLAESHDVFVIAGSLPRGIAPEQCAAWIQWLHDNGKQVFFDSSKAALSAGLEASPWLVKPNDEELADWAGRELGSEQAMLETAEQLSAKGIANVVVSLGAEGVMWLNSEGWLRSQPPKMNVVSTVGAGDTLVAGLCWGQLNQWDKEETLGFATALSALAVSQVGVGVEDINQVLKVKENVQVNNVKS
ncbi:1-phosphofructokinase [Photobacterium gaetbulicola]|uniref:Phosphofructokinase n=1 Tax=Photobacterium gaetbulicola Gung47 TaxID=658445 RepID=A0A0C5WBA9_9GAMM|nr:MULTISPECIES: 1-phosphofructokinase [Photobacterium]AJR08891.1 putative 1-phosphofructokinase [Photobacterium gaetbulicola Gung47]PSU13447.1 1-phosphofructokinase [Photobacterium gaetbulicola]WEM41019.1 1-phosphofructokinase [Photobacterium sp. DA100]